MKKTAIQELFSQLEIEHPNLFNTNTLEGRKFINDYYKFFELEKQQIIDAYLKAKGKGTIDKVLLYWDKAEEYYNEQFKNK
jgi:hypothetical protein